MRNQRNIKVDYNFYKSSSAKRRKQRRKSKKKRIKWSILTILAIIIIFSATSGFLISIISHFALLNIFFALTPSTGLLPESNILVLGVDTVSGTHRSDTIMVVHINPNEKEAKVISIPRDTIVVIPGRGLDKINHSYAYGGAELAKETAAHFFNVDIPYYVLVDIHGFANIIDKLGGITIDVEKRMYYVDFAGGLYVDLEPGRQRLSGRDAVAYVRYREEVEGDFGRIRRQQKFIRALADEIKLKKNILKSTGLIFELLSNVDTNLNIREIVGLAGGMRGAYELGRIEMTSIPGNDIMIEGVYYWRPDKYALQKIIREYLNIQGG